jgi:hypothetical protein
MGHSTYKNARALWVNLLLVCDQRLFHRVRVVAAQVFADGDGGGCALTGGADELLDAACAYVASGEDAGRAGLEIDAGQDEALGIQLYRVLEVLAIGRESDEGENTGGMQFLCRARLRIFGNDGLQAMVFALECNDLGIEAHLDLGRFHGLVDGYLIRRELWTTRQNRDLW